MNRIKNTPAPVTLQPQKFWSTAIKLIFPLALTCGPGVLPFPKQYTAYTLHILLHVLSTGYVLGKLPLCRCAACVISCVTVNV
jgi:hypothetical protein